MSSNAKDITTKGLKENENNHHTVENSDKNVMLSNPQICIENEIVSKQLAKSIKTFIEQSLLSDLNIHISEIQNVNRETWKIDAHNLSKIIGNESTLSCMHGNLSNILDTYLKDFNETGLQNYHDADIDVSPLLQPEHVIEIAECMSIEKPLDVRLNALRILCRSHFTDVVNGEGWILLQKKLVENLSDNNIDVFMLCLKAHAKLGSCSSPEAIKECSLNVIESLGQHYYLHQGESKITSFQSMHFYRSMYLVFLLLRLFQEATTNVARFGESKLQDMIENFIQLISINHFSKKNPKNKPYISPLEIVALLDPQAKWVLKLTHFNLSRQLFFSSLYNNTNFIRICVEAIFDWLSEPVLPPPNTKISDGDINDTTRKFSLFSHCLATFTTVCTFGMSLLLFPISINKKDLISIENILDLLINTINDRQFDNIFYSKTTSGFRSFFAMNLAKLLCLKQINGNLYLQKLLKTEGTYGSLGTLKTETLFIISKKCGFDNPLVCFDLLLKKRYSLFSHSFILNNSSHCNQYQGSVKKQTVEHQASSVGDVESKPNETSAVEIYLKLLLETTRRDGLKSDSKLIVIMTNLFKNFENILSINYSLKTEIVQIIGGIYKGIKDKIKNPDCSLDLSDIPMSHICAQFLLQCAMSPLGFHMLTELDLASHVLYEELQLPESNWSDYVWLNFVAKVSATEKGCCVLASESNNILRKELMLLWNTIDEDCSGSELPILECSNNLLRTITLLAFNIKGVKALLNEVKEGSEVTLTDDWENRPSNLTNLIVNFALSSCFTDFIHHHFSLTVLDIIISNIDACVYLLNRFNFQELLLQLQAENRVDDNSDVIIDECSLLRQKIIEKSYLPGRLRAAIKPTYIFPRPDSTLTRTKPRSRGNGEFARWLSETRSGLHDHSWLKHARKMYRNSSPDEIKGASIIDLLEQVLKVLPEVKPTIKWSQVLDENYSLGPEEQIAVQVAVRYGAHHRIFQGTQSNIDNLSQLLLVAKKSLHDKSDDFNGFDWFVASSFLLCSGNIEKSQTFLSLISTLPTASLLWSYFGKASALAQLGNALEIIISEEMPDLFQVLQRNGFSWWQLCHGWMKQCWWGVLDWPQICHWFSTAILYQPDHLLYFCTALLHSNHDRLLQMASQGTIYEIVTNPAEKFQLGDARALIDKLHKKYHGILQPYLISL